MALHKQARDTVEAHDTTDVQDAQLLADEIIALCQTSAYDDMTWAEFDAAFRLASHQIKLNWVETNSVKAPVAA